MLFNSLPFALFLAIAFGLYYLKPLKAYQIWILIVASMVFYSWTAPILVLLLVTSVGINAVTSFKVGISEPKIAWKWATVGVICNLGILGFFKYGGLLSNTFQQLAFHHVDWPIIIPLPIGISFYSFEGISLLVDTIRMREKGKSDFQVETNFVRHLRNTGLFITFFPHLIAGPILKARQFIPQISTKEFSDIHWDAALRHLIIGYALKTVVADNLKDYTMWINFPAFETLSSKTALVLLTGYSMQIFADFAGYSLIAIGLAYLFGYDLPVNFNFPYISKSFSEFWRRWHISLSTWLRDYLYFPLGGNRKGKFRTYVNLMIVMVLGGFWHGAAWSYMVWGGYHGVLLAIERLLYGDKIDMSDDPSNSWLDLARNTLKVLIVFSLVTFGWLFFKLPQFSEAISFMKVIATHWGGGLDMTRALPVIVYSSPVILYYWWNLPRVRKWRFDAAAANAFGWRRLETALYAIALIALFLNGGSAGEFIYFQF